MISTVGGIKTVMFPFRSVEMERAFCICRSIICKRPAYFHSVSVPFGPGLVARVIVLANPWLGSIERPPIDRSVKRSLVRTVSTLCRTVSSKISSFLLSFQCSMHVHGSCAQGVYHAHSECMAFVALSLRAASCPRASCNECHTSLTPVI